MPASSFTLASNALPHNAKIKTFIKDMEPVMELGPDALIMADPGLILMVRERWPDTAIHLSVQGQHHELRQRPLLAATGYQAHHPVTRTLTGPD